MPDGGWRRKGTDQPLVVSTFESRCYWIDHSSLLSSPEFGLVPVSKPDRLLRLTSLGGVWVGLGVRGRLAFLLKRSHPAALTATASNIYRRSAPNVVTTLGVLDRVA